MFLAYSQMNAYNRSIFRKAIKDEAVGHAKLATALQKMGFPIDRKQIHQFREKLRLGRVTLEPERPTQ